MDLNVRVCSMCQKMFKYRGNHLCQNCLDKIDQDYVLLRDQLYKTPKAGIQELNEATKVDEKVILHLLRVGRLSFAEGVDTGMRCSACGKNISSGNMCKACQDSISKSMSDALPADRKQKKDQPPTSTKAQGIRMHTASRRDDGK